MAFTQTDVDNLKAAIAAGRGARSITFENQTVVFHSVAEMQELLRMMQDEVSSTSTAGGASRTRYGATSKGV